MSEDKVNYFEKSEHEVLIVDDVPENLQVLGNILNENELDVSFASSGQQALAAVAFEPPDIILLDISMPEMDGFEVCQRLKSNPETKKIPVIFLTARTSSESIIKGFELGAVDYVTKPFNASELVSRVFTHLEVYKSRQLIQKQIKELEQKNKELHELNATKDKFFSIVAHDLKNPFNTLLGFTDLLVNNYKKMSEQKVARFHQYIYKTSKQGFTLLENLLEWSRSQTGRIDWEPINSNLKMVSREIVELLSINAKNKKIDLQNHISADITVFADPNMIKTIMRNLISNALKFTKKGGKVTISATKNEKMATVRVTDTGIGISSKVQNKLFRIDQSFSTLGTQDEKGTGLGLILCKEFVEKNNGEIWVDSELDKGTTFYFTLPLENMDANKNNDVIV